MIKSKKEAILISFYQSKPNYEKLANEIRRLFETDPSFPVESLYAIKHRIKSEDRLIEKIDKKNKKRKKVTSLIDVKNYQKRIEDILGIRIVCLRLSDVEKIESYLNSLKEEGKLVFVRRPQKKQTFILPVNPGEEPPKEIDLQYSGYSSIHYVVKLGRSLSPTREIAPLLAEVQLRTIFEEAWGEIDHKYRYEIARKGVNMPDHIQRDFYNLSAYLQATALQAEYLCRDAVTLKIPKKRPARKRRPAPPPSSVPIPTTIKDALKAKFDFSPTDRTTAYIERRLRDVYIFEDTVQILYNQILTEEALETFKNIYKEVMEREPFTNIGERDIDLLNAVNYALFRLAQPENVAKGGLVSVLLGRVL